jgi:hypothetical protein
MRRAAETEVGCRRALVIAAEELRRPIRSGSLFPRLTRERAAGALEKLLASFRRGQNKYAKATREKKRNS